MIFAWVDKGLMYMVRYEPGDPPDKAEHAMFVGEHVVWMTNGPKGEVPPFIDLEKAQLNMGRPWPPVESPVSM